MTLIVGWMTGITNQIFEQLNQVSYSFWCNDVKEPVEKKQRNVDLEVIPSEIQSHVIEELAEFLIKILQISISKMFSVQI